ncbi:MAG: 50S ribosomal protein L6 [Anaerovoracaceae bacterium]|nr:50S ribosomal protein L6 [Anaerovoracaceae bacterium]
MSRIGIKPITLPAGVEVSISDKNVVTVKGPKGELQEQISSLLTVENKDGVVTVSRDSDDAEKRSQHGLARTLINNMVVGVTEGYAKKLQLVGVGYKAEKKGKTLVLNLGYSHPIELEDPAGIETEAPDATTVVVKGIDKAQVGNYAANIRAWRRPEPYKGKGIRYEGEVIRRKEGKTGAQ